MELTKEQSDAILATGKVIVSASAGSGKTFVMIERLVKAISEGADLDEILAVTFTKKAAAQMKDKLRAAIIKNIEIAPTEVKAKLKVQLAKIQSADISTIHSLCAKLLRTYFYVLDIDGGFDIISTDDATACDLRARACDNLFERCYETDDSDFKELLKCFRKKRSDLSLRTLIFEGYDKVRACAHYEKLITDSMNIYTEEGFENLVSCYKKTVTDRLKRLIYAVQNFKSTFSAGKNTDGYFNILDEMLNALEETCNGDLFAPVLPLTISKKPAIRATATDEERAADKLFCRFRDDISKRYAAAREELEERQTELDYFLKSGVTAKAFCRILLQFDAEYAAVKREENKLDYNDLEHLTLKLLSDENIRKEINSKYKYVFVDEYQDVNPVQEEIISSFDGEVFLVGDVKQAIYGFRGSKSVYFSQKFKSFEEVDGKALRLSKNFRSSDGVLGFVNALFSQAMTSDTCGIDYAKSGYMCGGGGYPQGYGEAEIIEFGKEEKAEVQPEVYSVARGNGKIEHTREGLALLSLVEKLLRSRHYDLKKGCLVDTQPGDICILTRKNSGSSTEGIVAALRDAGYPVAGAQDGNICNLPEVKQFLDILSYIDNCAQDIPQITTMLSPIGGFCEDELANIKIESRKLLPQDDKAPSFRDCCEAYKAHISDEISRKLGIFAGQIEKLRALSDILNVGALSDEILCNYGFEAAYGAGGGEKIKNVFKLIEEGSSLTLPAFLQKIKSGGNTVLAPLAVSSDSIKIMSMHASKGLEFPVVILADICRTFKGADYEELPFDEEFGFAPKFFDKSLMLTHTTLLRRLVKYRRDLEELKNEYNLFYVACTRAMCKLYILASELKPYSSVGAYAAKSYFEIFDAGNLPVVKENSELLPDPEREISISGESVPEFADDELAKQIDERFAATYAYADSVNLPVKSSASAILRLRDPEPDGGAVELFGGEGETGTERGTAYHRFLELCDFSCREPEKITAEINNFVACGKMTATQASLLDTAQLVKILSMPIFADLGGAILYREQEFLCRLPADDLFEGVNAKDGVLVQGAIDLLAQGSFGWKIIDYKYSHKSSEALIDTYACQISIYRKAVAKITGVKEENIAATIVNILKAESVNL